MTMPLRKAIVVAAVACGCGLSAPAGVAQTLDPPVQRPVQGLFGRAPKTDGLDVTLSTFEEYDSDLNAAAIGILAPQTQLPQTQKSGPFDGLDAAVTFTQKFRHVSFRVSEQSAVRYYSALEDLVAMKHALTGGFAAQFDRTQLRFSQTLAYAPFYSYSTLPQLFDAQPGDVPVAPDQYLVRLPALVTASSAALSQTLGRATLSVSGTTQRTDFLQNAGNGLRADSASGRFLYHLTRDIGLVAGYAYQRGQYELVPAIMQTVEFHNLDVGLDYNHALSLTRRTTIGFTTGLTAVPIATGITAAPVSSGAPDYRLTGAVRISREIGRTWHATASYNRGAGLVAGFGQPIFSDSVALSVGGAIMPRLTLSTTAGYSTGELTAVTVQNGTDSYTGSARLQFALSRLMALTGEYDYYRYRFDSSVGLPDGIGQYLDRQSVQMGLSLWLPLFR